MNLKTFLKSLYNLNLFSVNEEVPDATSTIFVPRTLGPNYQAWVDPTTQSINSTHSNSDQLDTVDAPSLNNDNVSVVSVSPGGGSSSSSSSSSSELALSWRQFITKVNPFVDWYETPGYIKKLWLITKAPVIFIFLYDHSCCGFGRQRGTRLVSNTSWHSTDSWGPIFGLCFTNYVWS